MDDFLKSGEYRKDLINIAAQLLQLIFGKVSDRKKVFRLVELF